MTAIAQGARIAGGPDVPCDPLEAVRVLLERQQRALLRHAAGIADDIDDLHTATATDGHGETELATRHADVELRVALDLGTRATLEDIEGALARLDDGRYGICIECGQSIDRARLLALPQVEECIICRTRREGRDGHR